MNEKLKALAAQVSENYTSGRIVIEARRATCLLCDDKTITPADRDAFYAWCDKVELLPCTGMEVPKFE